MSDKIIKSIPIFFEKSLNQESDSRFMRVKIWICNIGENYNGSYFSKEVLTQMASTIEGIPIVGYIGKNKYKEIDFRSHEEQLVIKDDEYKFEYLGFAYGFIPHDHNAKFETKVGTDGLERTYLTAEGLIWTKWQEVIDIFEANDWTKGHSMELHDGSTDGYFDKKDKLYHFTSAELDALCVLGDDVQCAVPFSTIHKFSMSDLKNQITNMMNDYNKFSKMNESNKLSNNCSKFDNIDFAIPECVKFNAKNALLEHKNLGGNATSVALSTAKYLVKNNIISPTKVQYIYNFFSKHNDNVDPNDLTYMLWSGNEGRIWIEKLISEMNSCNSFNILREMEVQKMAKPKNVEPVVENVEVIADVNIDNADVSTNFATEVEVEVEEETSDEQKTEGTDGETTEEKFEVTPEEDYQKMYEALKLDYEAMKSEFEAMTTEYAGCKADMEAMKTNMSKMETEFATLTEYKLNKENKEKETLFSQFASNLTEDELKPIKDLSSTSTYEVLEEKLFALMGKKNFSLNSNNNSVISMGLDLNVDIKTENKSGKPYDDILQKYAVKNETSN